MLALTLEHLLAIALEHLLALTLEHLLALISCAYVRVYKCIIAVRLPLPMVHRQSGYRRLERWQAVHAKRADIDRA
jgi:hypothetical protein